MEVGLAKIKVQRKTCDRCTKMTNAEKTERFTYDGVDYEMDLCSQHLLDLSRDMRKWTAVARELETPYGELTKAGEAWHATIERESSKKVATVQPLRYINLDAELDDIPDEEPPEYSEWTMTEHAKERQLERGFTHKQVMQAVTHPENVYPSPKGVGYRIQQRGPVAVVTYPEHRAVVTVLYRDRSLYLAKEKISAHA